MHHAIAGGGGVFGEMDGKLKRGRAKRSRAKKDKFEEWMFRDLDSEERKLLKMERDKHRVIQAQIDRLTIQEVRIIGSVQKVKAESAGESNDDEEERRKRVQELMKELSSVQKMKADSVALKHKMTIDDTKYGLMPNVDMEQAKENAREVIEALQGEVRSRGNE